MRRLRRFLTVEWLLVLIYHVQLLYLWVYGLLYWTIPTLLISSAYILVLLLIGQSMRNRNER